MKFILSFSIDNETSVKINALLKKGSFRNKSHVVEEAIRKMHQGEMR
jgi:Arc/MetJ-type ribon-helix-helix transcriptional regulator